MIQDKIKKQGVIAGISLLIMALLAGFAFGYAHKTLVGDSPDLTFASLVANQSLFFAELAAWTLIFITDIIVALALYFFFRKASRQMSALTAAIRIVYTLILGIAIVQLFNIIPLLATDKPQHITEVATQLQLFERLWSIGLIIFGLHLIGLGYLSLKSKEVPVILGYLLYFGGLSYVFVHLSRQLQLLNADVVGSAEQLLALPMALSEILLAFWLIYHGFRKNKVAAKG